LQLQGAEDKLTLLKDVLHRRRTGQLQLAVARSRLAMRQAERGISLATAKGKAELAAARALYEMTRARAKRLDDQIRRSKVYAPRAGTVLHGRCGRSGLKASLQPVEEGTVVRCRQGLVHLVDSKRFKLELTVAPEIAQQVETGRKIAVQVDALPGETFQGRVVNIHVVPKPIPGKYRNRPMGVVTVMIDNPSGQLRVGMSARAELTR
jgi:multidrug efflux pump subunit AcrA (membrane-fusion protein)